MYYVLGAQVNVRSSILGDRGRAKEGQSEFLTLLGEVTRQPELAKNVQRYQLALDEVKERLDLAAAPEAWLIPLRTVINTESTAAYNDKLRQATPNMKLGMNKDVNKEAKKWGCVKWMAVL